MSSNATVMPAVHRHLQSGSCSTGSEEEEGEVSGESLADSAKHPRLQMSRHLSGLPPPKANGGQTVGAHAKGQGMANEEAAGYSTKQAQGVVGAVDACR
jgi:hypothetical protein